jgi:carbonic anhydrase/acetyltransferase-like protein (isoleucine patch superfamily)
MVGKILRRFREDGAYEVGRLAPELARGVLARRHIASGGRRLRLGPGVRWRTHLARIEIGDGVFVRRGAKLGVSGRAGQPAVLRIGDRVGIGDRSEIHCGRELVIGDDSLIAWDVVIMDRSYHSLGPGPEQPEPVRIGERVWIGCRSTVLPGVQIGDGAVVAAGSVVTRSVAPRTLVAGNPARVVREEVEWTP